jgi:hypothetical protein
MEHIVTIIASTSKSEVPKKQQVMVIHEPNFQQEVAEGKHLRGYILELDINTISAGIVSSLRKLNEMGKANTVSDISRIKEQMSSFMYDGNFPPENIEYSLKITISTEEAFAKIHIHPAPFSDPPYLLPEEDSRLAKDHPFNLDVREKLSHQIRADISMMVIGLVSVMKLGEELGLLNVQDTIDNLISFLNSSASNIDVSPMFLKAKADITKTVKSKSEKF